MKYVTVKEMISIEKAADAAGYSYHAMMEAAGKGLAEKIRSRFDQMPGKRISALVGSGNNGGDALISLDYLGSWGWDISALICKPRPVGDVLIERFVKRGGRVVDWTSVKLEDDQIIKELSNTDLIIDGLLGTGIKLPLKDPLRSLLLRVNKYLLSASEKPKVVAVDCPSGVDCDTGEVDPASLPADLTVTMAAVKKGLLEFPAYSILGELILVEIGLPDDLPEYRQITRELITPEWVKSVLPQRPLDAHKGIFGTALIIAGSINYPGAAVLAGEAAYRAGAGLVTIAVPESIYQGLIKRLPEATWIRLDDHLGGISEQALSQVEKSLDKPTACLVGPGLGLNERTERFLEGLIKIESLPPLVLDADGLRLIRKLKGWPGVIPAGSILTPHPGEMSALTGLTIAEIQSDRIGIAEKYAKNWEQVIVLKGAHTVIADPDGRSKIFQGGNPGLAKAGSGDVLAGIICGLRAQGLAPFEAASSGVWIHGQAGKLASTRFGSTAAVLAGEINALIGEVFPT